MQNLNRDSRGAFSFVNKTPTASMSGLLARLLSSHLQNVSLRFTPATGVACSLQQLQIREKSTKPKRRKVHPFHWWARKNRSDMSEDHLTRSNLDFLSEVNQKIHLAPGECPLREEPWESKNWTPGCRRTGLVARKIGVYPMWTKEGKRITSTLLQVCEQSVLSYIPPEVFENTKFGFRYKGKGAVVVGAEPRDPNRFSQEYLNLFKESGVAPTKKVVRFVITPDAALQPSTPLSAGHFRAGDYVNVYGKTIDRKYMGAKRRWGMKGGRATHGVTKNHHRAGAMGGPRGRILKGKKMGGHEGQERRLLVGLQVLRINYDLGVLWVTGQNVPGETNAFVKIFDCYIEKKAHKAENPPPFPTYFAEGGNPLPDEVYASSIQPFGEPSIEFEEEKQVKRKLKVKAKVKAAGRR